MFCVLVWSLFVNTFFTLLAFAVRLLFFAPSDLSRLAPPRRAADKKPGSRRKWKGGVRTRLCHYRDVNLLASVSNSNSPDHSPKCIEVCSEGASKAHKSTKLRGSGGQGRTVADETNWTGRLNTSARTHFDTFLAFAGRRCLRRV